MTTTAPENIQAGINAFVVPTPCRVTHDTEARETVRVVVDNAAFAWTNNESGVLNALHPDLVHDYSEALDTAAINRLGPLLIEVWAEHGFHAVGGTYDEVYDSLRGIDRATYWAVADEAASRLDVDQLVKDARLVDVQRSLYTD